MTHPNRFLKMSFEELLAEFPSSVHPSSGEVTQPLAALLILSVQQVATGMTELQAAITTSSEASDRLADVGNQLSRTLARATWVIAAGTGLVAIGTLILAWGVV